MSYVTITTPENRLAKILGGIEGRTVDEMVADAETRVGQLSGAIRLFATEQVARIMAIHKQGEVAMFGHCRTIADLALSIAEVAGAAQMVALGEVARGVCAMVDCLITSGIWHTEALDLHLTSLSLLCRPDAPSEREEARMIARLREMRFAIGVPD